LAGTTDFVKPKGTKPAIRRNSVRIFRKVAEIMRMLDRIRRRSKVACFGKDVFCAPSEELPESQQLARRHERVVT
jgi:hypothetical protein